MLIIEIAVGIVLGFIILACLEVIVGLALLALPIVLAAGLLYLVFLNPLWVVPIVIIGMVIGFIQYLNAKKTPKQNSTHNPIAPVSQIH